MNIDHLVQMANRIGEFFQSMPDAEQAGSDIVLHLRKFWAPPMRQQLLAHVDASTASSDGDGLMPIVHDAVIKHRLQLI